MESLNGKWFVIPSTAAFGYKRPFADRSKDTVIIERSQIFLNGRVLRGRFSTDLGYFLGSKTFGMREGGKELFHPANKSAVLSHPK